MLFVKIIPCSIDTNAGEIITIAIEMLVLIIVKLSTTIMKTITVVITNMIRKDT